MKEKACSYGYLCRNSGLPDGGRSVKKPTDIRYNERSNVERVNGRLKDEFGGKMIRVRGHAKVMTHLMFGIIALTADQLMRFVT